MTNFLWLAGFSPSHLLPLVRMDLSGLLLNIDFKCGVVYEPGFRESLGVRWLLGVQRRARVFHFQLINK